MKSMRKMHRAALLLAVLVLVTGTVGCGKKNTSDSTDKKNGVTITAEATATATPTPTPADDPNGIPCGPTELGAPYFDYKVKNGENEWTFRSDSSTCTMTDFGIFSDHLIEGRYLEFRLTDVESGEQEIIGIFDVPDGEQVYETKTSRQLIGDNLYTIVTVGDMYDKEAKLTQYLLKFDLDCKIMYVNMLSEDGFPYVMLAQFDGRLIFYNIESGDGDQCCVLYRFDPKGNSINELKRLPWGTGTQHEMYRGVWADRDRIYLLRVVYEGDVAKQLYVDVYFNHSSSNYSLNMTPEFTKAVLRHNPAEVVPDEMIQYVVSFRWLNDCGFIYENASVTSFFVNVGEHKLVTDAELSAAKTSDPTVNIFFLRNPDEALADTTAHCYRLDGWDLKPITIPGAKESERIDYISIAPNGTALIEWAEIVPDGQGGAEYTGERRMEIVKLN
ncbi:MAG: hypothetical protein J5645_00070 [Lachnospiraceae bacterium]|nr:hypothetical protein [Lachnospiraceae bacterium]